MQDRLDTVTASYNGIKRDNAKLQNDIKVITASKDALTRKNSEIIKELESVKNNNLIYKQKIECSSADIEQKDATISDLQKELNKTVVASTNAKREASNRDEEVKHLKSQLSTSNETIKDLESRVVGCEELLHSYQQAYADFYATAIGTSVSGLPVTASTSVRELENLIQGATNTSNLSAAPLYEDPELPVDVIDDLDDSNLATL
jgi:uncharacterized protein (DUF3084 family)